MARHESQAEVVLECWRCGAEDKNFPLPSHPDGGGTICHECWDRMFGPRAERHESQAESIDRLVSLVNAINALPEHAETTEAMAWKHHLELGLSEKSFCEMFAGKEAKIDHDLYQFSYRQDGIEYVCRAYDTIKKLASVPPKTYVMPALPSTPFDPSRCESVATMHAEMDLQESEGPQ